MTFAHGVAAGCSTAVEALEGTMNCRQLARDLAPDWAHPTATIIQLGCAVGAAAIYYLVMVRPYRAGPPPG